MLKRSPLQFWGKISVQTPKSASRSSRTKYNAVTINHPLLLFLTIKSNKNVHPWATQCNSAGYVPPVGTRQYLTYKVITAHDTAITMGMWKECGREAQALQATKLAATILYLCWEVSDLLCSELIDSNPPHPSFLFFFLQRPWKHQNTQATTSHINRMCGLPVWRCILPWR